MSERVIDTPERFLTKEEILAKDDISFIEHIVPQWGGKIRFRALTGQEAIDFGQMLRDETTKENGIIRLFTISVVDENGDHLFDEKDIRALRKKNWAVFLKAQKVLLDFNGYTDKSAVTAKND